MARFRPLEVDGWVAKFEDPWVRQMMRAYAEGWNRMHFGDDWRNWKPPWWERWLAKVS